MEARTEAKAAYDPAARAGHVFDGNTAARQAEIPDGLDRLGRTLDDLLGSAQVLRERLDPALRDSPNEVDPRPEAIPSGSEIGRVLDARVLQARAVQDVLSDLLGRLEV